MEEGEGKSEVDALGETDDSRELQVTVIGELEGRTGK